MRVTMRSAGVHTPDSRRGTSLGGHLSSRLPSGGGPGLQPCLWTLHSELRLALATKVQKEAAPGLQAGPGNRTAFGRWRTSTLEAMASPRIEAVIRERHRMGECPVWEEETGQLVYVDINARTVCRWNPLSGEVQTMGLRDPVGRVALCREGSYVVASGTCLGLLDWATGQVEWAAWLDRDKPHNRFNDGKVDPAGRFVAGGLLKGLALATWRASCHGTMPEASAPGVWEPGQGSLYTLFADCPVVRQLDQLGIHNGLDWSLDHRTLYHVDSLDYSVRAYDYDVQTGGLANPRLVCQLEPEQGMPDGLCVDTTGTLWVACIDGGRVIRMDPDTGTRLCTL
ncbi:regucalcin-like isoform X2 [Ictidomys tridecemlineatus]